MPRRHDIWDDALFSLRTRGKRTAFWAIVVFLALMVAGGVYVSIVWYIQVRPSIPDGSNLENIPMTSLASGYVEMSYCVYEGPETCEEYDDAKQAMISSTSGQALVYTPLSEDAPGTDVGAGTRSVIPSEDLTDEEWHALAASLTLDGTVTPATTGEDAMNADESTTTVSFAGNDNTRGTVTFTVDDAGVRVSSFTYAGT